MTERSEVASWLSTVLVRRPPRRPAPEIPTGELLVDPPPEIPPRTGTRWTAVLLGLPMLGGALAAALMFAGQPGGGYSTVVGVLFGVSSLAMLGTTWAGYPGGPRRGELVQARREYLRHLAGLRRRVRETTAKQRDGLHYRHPEPGQLWSTVDSYRLWERRPTDSDFAVVRIGIGPQALATPVRPPVTRPLDDLEPMTATALRRFLEAYAVVADLPVAVSLPSFSRIHLLGGAARGLARAMLAQLATFHPPDDLLIAVCAGPDRLHRWEWVKWLPHARDPAHTDGAGPCRLIATTTEMLPGVPAEPYLVVVLDGAGPIQLNRGRTTVLDLAGPPPRLPDRNTLVIEVGEPDRALRTTTVDDEGEVGTADALSIVEAEALARRLAPLRLAATGGERLDLPAGTEPDPARLLGLGDPLTFTVQRGWAPRPAPDRLRVPIGTGVDGSPVPLDLKESAQDGMGPHGLLIGATGSGKSELLRTLVLGLAATHSSAALNFVLIDFKGGATFASFDRLPHTAAMITNLADALPLVDRMAEALRGELNRRQELLRRAGNLASLREYQQHQRGTLPVLLVICDEFAELLSAKPELIDVFVQIGRLGRSLGVHLLLASQRLDEGRLRGLETHLSYRIGLRTFSTMESRAVLGVPDAYELPRSPGHGFLRYGTEAPIRFRAGYVSGRYHRDRPASRGIMPFGTEPVPLPPPAAPAGTASLLDLVVDRLAGQGVPAHPVWLPPLTVSPTLDDLLGPVAVDPVRGLTVGNPDLRGALQVPIGLVDQPYEQRTDLLWLNLSGSAGHVAVVGGPRSGKSTVVRTLVAALVLTHTPDEVQVYCLDFGGGTLAELAGLPHVGGVAGRQDAAAVRRTVGEIASLLADRERAPATTVHSAVFLVVDGWATLRGEYDDLEPVLTDLATRGLGYGVHLVITGSRWTDLRPSLRDLFGSTVELRLGDPTDSMVDRRAAANVPEGRPGHGLTSAGQHCLVATVDSLGTLAKSVATGWTGPTAAPVRLLPAQIPYSRIEESARTWRLPIGLAETDLGLVRLDLVAEPHLIVFGDAESGKSSLLRMLAATITRRFAPEQARIILVDYRRSLLGAVDGEHLIGYGTSAASTRELIESVAGYLEARLPGPDVTPAQLADRSWWTGPACILLVDDYDLVATGPDNPLLPLVDYLAQGRDLGLHVIVTRRSGGAGRALYDPLLQRLRELPSPGLVLSGDPDEGPLLGQVRPGPLPPGRGRLVTRKEGVRVVQLALPPD